MNKPSLKKNIIFNYIGQGYTGLIGLLTLPLFLGHVGKEAFGLIGFYLLVISWMNLLDLGITPTLGREVTRLNARRGEEKRLRKVVNSLEMCFVSVAVLFCVSLFTARHWVAANWLQSASLPLPTVQLIIGIIAITVSVRWVSGLSRSGINAYEFQGWVNIINIISYTLRFPVALLLAIKTSGNIVVFFCFQLIVVCFEGIVIRIKFRSLMPKKVKDEKRFSLTEIQRVAPFALSVGYTGAVSVIVTQIDKLVFSKALTLSDYGYFTLIATITTGLTLLAGPVIRAALPRMTAMLAKGREQETTKMYRQMTRIIASFIIPITILIAIAPDSVIYVWTGQKDAALWTSRSLPLYIIGSALMTLNSFQYTLQYAYGSLKLHVLYHSFLALIIVPIVIYMAFHYGVFAVGCVWLIISAVTFTLWTPVVHNKFAPGMHIKWLLSDILPIVMVALSINFFFLETSNLVSFTSSRWNQFLGLVICIVITFASSLIVSWREYIPSVLTGRS